MARLSVRIIDQMHNAAKYRCRLLTGILVALATLAAVSCGGSAAATSSTHTASNLSLNLSTVDFGSVSVGSSKSLPITLSNSSISGDSISASQITVTGTGFSGNIPTLPLVLGSGQSFTLNLVFKPTSAGSVSGTLSITVDGVAQPITVPLSGDGLAAGQLAANPTTLNFGNVNVGSSLKLPGTLTAGSSNITISSASWNGTGYSLSGITFPVTVQAGKSVSFMVTFAPQTTGTANGSVSFVSDASNSPTNVTLTGNGTQPASHSVSLSWNASTSLVSGYNIYRRVQSGSYGAPLNVTPQPGLTFTDNNVNNGTTYFYVVTAVDSSSRESINSNEAMAVIP